MPFGFRFPNRTLAAGIGRGLNIQRHRGKNLNFNTSGIAGPQIVLTSIFPRAFRGAVGERIETPVAQIDVNLDLTPALRFIAITGGKLLSHRAASNAGLRVARGLGRTLSIEGVVDGFFIVERNGRILLSQEVAAFGAPGFHQQLNDDLFELAKSYVFNYLDAILQFAFVDDFLVSLRPR